MNQSAVNLETTCYRRFTLKAAWELAAPRTWSAAISPVLIGGAFALATGAVPLALNARLIVIWVCMLITSVLMQSAANALNDYKDFISGTDDASNAYDPTDASIIYNAVNPKCALQLCAGLLVAAAICGTVVVMLSSAIIAVIGAVAALTVVFYSAGPKPISYLPLSETVSGIVMGGFITFATSYALSGTLDARCVLVALPAIICVGLIMQTNNTCDVARDARAGRVTIPILFGEKCSIAIMTTLACVAVCGILALCVVLWPAGVMFAVANALVAIPRILLIARGPYEASGRSRMMGNINALCMTCGVTFALGLLMSAVL